MKYKLHRIYGIGCAVAVMLLVFDAKAVLLSCREGVNLCLGTVIPSLFPFFFFCPAVTALLSGCPLTGSLEKLLRLPKGAGSLYLTGLLSGYPIGAQAVAQACRTGSLSESTARRMLGFCNNAGPAFIFGMGAGLFSDPRAPWLLWLVHILSSLAAAFLLPGRDEGQTTTGIQIIPGPRESLKSALSAMASVCGWVILFRIMIDFLKRWCLWALPGPVTLCITGLLELTNGFAELLQPEFEALRFLFSAGFLGFGGFCVTLQTLSVTGSLGLGKYFPGKVIQAVISVLLAYVVQRLILQ